MHDDTSATSRDPETVMAIALSEAGVCPIDPDLAPLPATFAAEVPDPDETLHASSATGHATEAVAAVYTQLARIDTAARHRDAADLEPHLNAVIDWNDTDGRSYEDIRELTAAALRHLDARRR